MMANVRSRVANFIYPEGEQHRRRLEDRNNDLVDVAYTDMVTKLGNRAAFDLAVKRGVGPDKAYVMFDLNHLGLVNKRYGHEEGDSLIRWAGEVIQLVCSMIGFPRTCYRLGGDEFVVICDRWAAEYIVTNVTEIFGSRQYEGFRSSIGGSWGDTLKEADGALQSAKAEVKARHASA
jgi:GGDEF domain-containing protein